MELILEEPMASAAAPDGGLRARRRVETGRDIESAALSAVEANGFDATTMDQIAEAAGVSVRTAFRYFPAKVDTVLLSARQVSDALARGLADDVRDSPSLEHIEGSIARSLASLVESDPAVIARLKRLRRLMLGDARLRAEVAKSDGYQASIDELLPTTGVDRLGRQLVSKLTAATMSSAFDSWADADAAESELIAHYQHAREVRDSLVARHH